MHNSNLLGSAVGDTAKYRENEEYLTVARDAVSYSCKRQLADAMVVWEYLEYHLMSPLHTAYNLDSISRYISSINAGGTNTHNRYCY